ncbi:MAG TPA: flippase activity-associated protein Agl23 [Pyrinomonadaceae bacterium]
MDTSSTKSRAGKEQKKARSKAKGQQAAGAPHLDQPGAAAVSKRAWLIGSISVMLVAACLRLYDLNLVPLHHDEGVNGNFLLTLFRQHIYRYDPSNYHGPTLYYFALAISYLLGLNTFAIRLVTVLFGLATIWLVLLLRRHIGAVGSLTAAALLAVSPGAVYLSRYFIHETLFVFFTLGIAYAALRYYEAAHPVYLWLASASAALLFATKETAIISAGVFLIALAVMTVYVRLRERLRGETGKKGRGVYSGKSWQGGAAIDEGARGLERFGGPISVLTHTLVALLIFIVVSVLFYSSFFTNYPKGVQDALSTFKFWSRTGKEAHVHEWYTYLGWLWQEEAPLLALGALGALCVVWRGRNRLALFIALWAFGLLAAYSLVPYKTPWLTLNFIVPLAIIGGYGVDVVYRAGDDVMQRLPALLLALAAIIICSYQSIRLNFIYYDDDHYPYVYAHTRREMLGLVDEVNRLAQRAGSGQQTGITIISPDYWPLPWYFRDYKRVGYFGRMVETGEPIIIGNEGQDAQMQASLANRYRRVGAYDLRPGVTLVLYARSDLSQ